MIEVVPAAELGEAHRARLAEVFVDGFGEDLAYFSQDRRVLAAALAHMLVLEVFHVGLVDGRPAGMAACTDGRSSSVRRRVAPLLRHLGPVKGAVASVVFRREFERPIDDPAPGKGSIEFVATAREHRGKGVASAVLRHILDLPQYREYVIDDVADTNAAALRLYEKAGFREYRRRPVGHTERTGINSYVSLRLVDG